MVVSLLAAHPARAQEYRDCSLGESANRQPSASSGLAAHGEGPTKAAAQVFPRFTPLEPCIPAAARGAQAPLQVASPPDVRPGRAFLYSAVIPGSGQRLQGQWRWVGYLAIEAWSWFNFVDSRADGRELQSRYRDLAWFVARAGTADERVDRDFNYYEAMTKFVRSGSFDADPFAGGIQPDPDPETFNGSVWLLAKDIFFRPDLEEPPTRDSPEFVRALDYYRDRAVGPDFAWTWEEAEENHTVFKGLIDESDDRLRRSTTMLGIIIGNHVLSAMDGYISARLRRQNGTGPDVSLRALPGLRAGEWQLLLRVTP